MRLRDRFILVFVKTQILMNLLELDGNLTILTLHVTVNPMAIQSRISQTFLLNPIHRPIDV